MAEWDIYMAEPAKDAFATTTPVNPEDQLTALVSTAARTAVAESFTNVANAFNGGGIPVKKTASLDFDAASGKWRVAHRVLAQPMLFASKVEAEQFRLAITAEEQPKVSWDESKQVYQVSHADWDKPVEAKAAEETTEIVERKLEEKGWDTSEAKQRAGELTASARKEQIMASVAVAANTKQNVKDGSVSGIQDDAGAKSSKGEQPTVGGKVSTEAPAIKTLPDTKNPEALVQKHDGDYNALANKAEALAKQLSAHKGIMKTCSGLIDKYGADAVEKEWRSMQDRLAAAASGPTK